MTLKVLIVDDEPIICQGLMQTVPWRELGAEVVGEASDGEEAIELMESHEVDLVLSDVKMPLMDGLQLAEYISIHLPDVRMVLISGYDEFEYAKRAMRLGVKDYLLKPVDIDELMKLVSVTHEETMKKKKKDADEVLNHILSSAVLGHNLELDKLKLMSDRDVQYQLLGSELKDYFDVVVPLPEDEQHQFKIRWKNLVENELNQNKVSSVSFFIDENRLIVCCEGNEDVQLDAAKYTQIVQHVEEKLGAECFLCASGSFSDPEKAGDHYKALINGMNAHPHINKKMFEADRVSERTMDKEFPEPVLTLVKQLKESDATGIHRITEKIFRFVEENKWSLEEVLSSLLEVEEELFAELDSARPTRLNPDLNLTIYNSYQGLRSLFEKNLMDYHSIKQNAACKGPNWLMKKAVTYIQDHYSSDLKAAEIANVINVSPNYFSQLIKQGTGKHFNDYLHEVRIGNAKILLKETPYRVFEIAEIVGYKDYKYFVQIFKKTTGCTPTHFRKIIAHTEISGSSLY
jgi:two-component system, response regulator YesN